MSDFMLAAFVILIILGLAMVAKYGKKKGGGGK